MPNNFTTFNYDFFFHFKIPVKCTHPAESRIRQLAIPGSGEVLAAVQGNNEVGLWNLESQFRQLVLWASRYIYVIPIIVTAL